MTMEKARELASLVKDAFNANSDAQEFFVTQDGQCFTKAGQAQAHGSKIDPVMPFILVKRSDAFPNTELAEGAENLNDLGSEESTTAEEPKGVVTGNGGHGKTKVTDLEEEDLSISEKVKDKTSGTKSAVGNNKKKVLPKK